MTAINGELLKLKFITDKSKFGPEKDILYLYEELAKLWRSIKADKKQATERLINSFIALMIVSNKLGIDNLELHYNKKIKELLS